jgi:site-specific recombinase XerD
MTQGELTTVPTNSSRADNLLSDSNPNAGVPVKSYARANQELAAAYDRYLLARGFTSSTRRSYRSSVREFVASLDSTSAVQADHLEIRQFFGELMDRGVGSVTIRRHTASLRCFFRFLQLGGLRRHDPTLKLPHRRLPTRLPRVLTIEEVERLIATARNPLEAAVAEFFYSTGVRVSELVAMRLEDVHFATGVAWVKNGKGGKDRIVLFGRKADAALRRMIKWRPPKAGFLFEPPVHLGHMWVRYGSWYGGFYDKSLNTGKHLRTMRLGRVSDLPTHPQARRVFDHILATTPSYKPRPTRPYAAGVIERMVVRMGIRADIGRVYPHALRRAFASHMLALGADLRVIQDLLGHENVRSTVLYTLLSIENLKEVHTRCHPMA